MAVVVADFKIQCQHLLLGYVILRAGSQPGYFSTSGYRAGLLIHGHAKRLSHIRVKVG